MTADMDLIVERAREISDLRKQITFEDEELLEICEKLLDRVYGNIVMEDD